jgi:proline dehydrogenase
MIPPPASRFVAGESAATALEHARRLNDDSVGAILNLLGEHYEDSEQATADARAYCRLLDDIAGTDLRVRLSVKPTQLGLGVSTDLFRRNLERVVEHAAGTEAFVWLDMEDHTTTDATLEAYEAHATDEGNVGVCLQANRRRTAGDIERLAGLPGKVRLVKGAYDPPAEIAYQSSERVDEAYRNRLAELFASFESGIAVGSHDPAMLSLAASLSEKHDTHYEIQMLMGVRAGAQRDLARNREVWQYVPYGGKWLSYFYRRVTENLGNARFALRALAPA